MAKPKNKPEPTPAPESSTPAAGQPDPAEPQSLDVAPEAATLNESVPEPAQPDHPPTLEEIHTMADLLERFGARLLKAEDRLAKISEHMRQNYGVKV